ncbi:deubiquitinase OTUD6B-like [Dysidea avara]|uniref:deubiquitinase OTUD6B-like n=1 Tax=Dysidea avara TaxID=196820 RepID=UPI0033172A91
MNEQCSFIDSVSRVIVRENFMETKVKKCDPIDQQEGSERQQGTQNKNPPCSDRQDRSVKVKSLEKFDPNGSNNEQETSEGIQAEESLCLESLVRKDKNMQALNLDTHHVSKLQAGVEKPGHISTKKQQCSDQKAIIKTDHTQISHDQETSDVQLVTAYAKPSKYRTIQSILKHLQLKRHTVKGDGSCLYHAIAHQAGLIASSSTGDEVVSNHLRQLTLLAMLNYPAIQLECSLSDQDWQAKRLQVLTTCEWGGDIELRLMAVGLKRDIIVVTDSNLGNVFARKVPHQPPTVPKMKGGIFIPVTSDEPCTSDQSTQIQNCFIIVYNGSNHYNSTLRIL